MSILGTGGILPLKQPFLRSLSLITDPMCYGPEYDELDLSSFHRLQSLRWKAMHTKDLTALAPAIRLNRAHLRTLELEVSNWRVIQIELDLSSDEDSEDRDSEEGSTADRFFAEKILGLHRRRPRLLLPQLRVLNLTQVPLRAAMAHAINFDTLGSLTLRMCPGWCGFIKTALELGVPLRLATLEIQETDNVSGGLGIYTIMDLLNGFRGLEELFISHSGPEEPLDIWNAIANCHPTLRRFVHHQRTVDTDEESPNFEQEEDLPDMALFGRDVRLLREDSLRNNPLARLDLECIGLCCLPGRLVSIYAC
jgi:hypothetical protein